MLAPSFFLLMQQILLFVVCSVISVDTVVLNRFNVFAFRYRSV